MRKMPVMKELNKLQHYIKRFCPELTLIYSAKDTQNNLTHKEQEILISMYLDNIRTLATDDDWIN